MTVYSYLFTFDPGSGGTLLGTSNVVWDVYGNISTVSVKGYSSAETYRLKWVRFRSRFTTIQC